MLIVPPSHDWCGSNERKKRGEATPSGANNQQQHICIGSFIDYWATKLFNGVSPRLPSPHFICIYGFIIQSAISESAMSNTMKVRNKSVKMAIKKRRATWWGAIMMADSLGRQSAHRKLASLNMRTWAFSRSDDNNIHSAAHSMRYHYYHDNVLPNLLWLIIIIIILLSLLTNMKI